MAQPTITNDWHALLDAIYNQVLDRSVYVDGSNGKNTFDYWNDHPQNVRDIVCYLGQNPEFYNKIIKPTQDGIDACYMHFLARHRDYPASNGWETVLKTQGWDAVVYGIVNGPEYNELFGLYSVPGDTNNPARLCASPTLIRSHLMPRSPWCACAIDVDYPNPGGLPHRWPVAWKTIMAVDQQDAIDQATDFQQENQTSSFQVLPGSCPSDGSAPWIG